MYKIGVIGDKDSIRCFVPLGIDTFAAVEEDEVKRTFQRLAGEGYAILYITEDAAAKISDLIGRYADEQLPAVIPIPSTKGSLGMGKEKIKNAVERAVGSDIL